jgi:hypothetical protein
MGRRAWGQTAIYRRPGEVAVADEEKRDEQGADDDPDVSINELIQQAFESSGLKKDAAKGAKGTIAAVLFALAALIGSIGNFVYGSQDRVSTIITKDDNITEAAYEKLRSAIDDQAEALRKSQEDVAALRNFMAGFMQAVQSNRGSAPRPLASVEALLPPARKPEPKASLPNYGDVKYEAALEEAKK